MKRGWPLFLLVSMFALAGAPGCHHDHDDDDDHDGKASIEIDAKGDKKGIEVKD